MISCGTRLLMEEVEFRSVLVRGRGTKRQYHCALPIHCMTESFPSKLHFAERGLIYAVESVKKCRQKLSL